MKTKTISKLIELPNVFAVIFNKTNSGVKVDIKKKNLMNAETLSRAKSHN